MNRNNLQKFLRSTKLPSKAQSVWTRIALRECTVRRYRTISHRSSIRRSRTHSRACSACTATSARSSLTQRWASLTSATSGRKNSRRCGAICRPGTTSSWHCSSKFNNFRKYMTPFRLLTRSWTRVRLHSHQCTRSLSFLHRMPFREICYMMLMLVHQKLHPARKVITSNQTTTWSRTVTWTSWWLQKITTDLICLSLTLTGQTNLTPKSKFRTKTSRPRYKMSPAYIMQPPQGFRHKTNLITISTGNGNPRSSRSKNEWSWSG